MAEISAIIKAKSKDYLLGYIDCFISVKSHLGCLDRIVVKGDQITVDSEQNKILGPSYLDLTCTCGNYIAFKTGDEIPDKSFKCSLCEKNYMIYYTDEEKL